MELELQLRTSGADEGGVEEDESQMMQTAGLTLSSSFGEVQGISTNKGVLNPMRKRRRKTPDEVL